MDMGKENIVDLVKGIEAITDRLVEILSKESLTDADLDKVIFNLDKRKDFMDTIDQSDEAKTNLYREIMKRLVAKDREMNELAVRHNEALKIKIRKNTEERKMVGKKKNANRTYMNTSQQTDGYFIDSKK